MRSTLGLLAAGLLMAGAAGAQTAGSTKGTAPKAAKPAAKAPTVKVLPGMSAVSAEGRAILAKLRAQGDPD